MSINFAAAIKTEIAELEAEFRADPRYSKLQYLRQLLALYEPGPARQSAPGGNGAAHADAAATKEERIRLELRVWMRTQGGTVHRLAALQHLLDRGLMGHEKDPMANLAAYMSHWKDEFASDGAGNWSLRH
jgi:hypothetical protein